jgi:hypothetical protein
LAVCVIALGVVFVLYTDDPQETATSGSAAARSTFVASRVSGTPADTAENSAVAVATPEPTACWPEPALAADPGAVAAALGTAFIREGGEYRLVSLDRPEHSRRVVSCTGRAAIAAGVAGVTGTGRETTLYFTTHQAIPEGVTELYRVRLIGGTPERVLAYSGRPDEAAISPDGRAVAYANRTGLRVRELATQDDRLLQRHETFCPTSHRDCYMNSAPVWSGDSRYIAYFEYHGEAGGITQVIEPATTPVVKTELRTGGLIPVAWSPTGESLCGIGGVVRSAGGLFAIPGGRPQALEIPGMVSGTGEQAFRMTACAWASDGRLAVSHAQRSMPDAGTRAFVTFFSRDLQLEGVWQAAGVPRGWTADGRAVVLEHDVPQESPSYSLLYTDGRIVELDIEADALLAVVTAG